MSTTTFVWAWAIPIAEVHGCTASELRRTVREEGEWVFVWSRNGRVIENVREIVNQLPVGSDLYLLGQSCVLTGEHLREACETIEVILREVERNPGIVCVASDGLYTEDEIVACLKNAQAAKDPEASRDDEGENIEYTFALLKSHLALLKKAAAAGMAVVYDRTN